MFARHAVRALVAGVAIPLSLAAGLHADVIVTAFGKNTSNSSNFFTVSAIAMPQGVFLEQIRIDLQGGSDPSAFWDANQPGGNSPWGFKSGSGITAAEMRFNPANGSPAQPSLLEITMSPGAMASGDWFTFDFDTDFTINNGDEFGEAGVTVDFVFSNQVTVSTAFIDDGIKNNTSIARAPSTSISEPRTVGVLSAGSIVLCFAFRRRQQRSQRR